MLIRLILLFTIVPLVELTILLKLSNNIGFIYTLAIVIFTGGRGVYFAKSQGKEILFRIRNEMQSGRMPGNQLLNGLCVLVGGAMLLTPGILTDTLGFLLVLPIPRELIKVYIKRKIQNMIEEGRVNFNFRR